MLVSHGRTPSGGKTLRERTRATAVAGSQRTNGFHDRHTEDGCPKRFEVMGKQAQREASGRRGSALPMSHHGLPPHHQAHSQHMSSLGHSTPYFQPEAFPPSPQ